MGSRLRRHFFVLMFLQYFIWGTWYVTMGTYMLTNLEANAVQVGSAYAAFSIAAMISPFLIGLMADRYVDSKYMLGSLHLLGGLVLCWLADMQHPDTFWGCLFLYTLLYTPTISLVNAICFQHMANPEKEFPGIRVMGTLGWIVAGLAIGFLHMETSRQVFYLGGFFSLVLAVLCFRLPTRSHPVKPAHPVNLRTIWGLDALVLLKDRSYALFFVASILICIPLTFYYSFANPFLNDIDVQNAAGKMTLGQASEVLFMLLIPWLFVRLGVKKMLLIGLLSWTIRYVLFSFGDAERHLWMLLFAIALHGACYDFFFVTGQIYTERKAGEHMKNAAQGLITLATYGVGMLIGSYVSGWLTQGYIIQSEEKTTYNWESVWLIPAAFSAFLFFLVLLFFRERASMLDKKVQEYERTNS